MKRGQAYTPDGPLTLGDLREIVLDQYGDGIRGVNGTFIDDLQIVEVRTPMGPDRRRVTLTVTSERWEPPAVPADTAEPQPTEQEQQHG